MAAACNWRLNAILSLRYQAIKAKVWSRFALVRAGEQHRFLGHGFTGHAEAPLLIGYGVMVAGNVILGAICWALFRAGYRLRP